LYHDPTARQKCLAWVLTEVLVLEMLAKRPHPHIIKYHGVVVEGNRIVGPSIERLPQSLAERCRAAAPPLDVEKVTRSVENSLTHVHSFGYCYNNVNPQNIMLTDDDAAVLIDFDSCILETEPLSKGTMPCWGNGSTLSSKDKDLACLDQVKKHLVEVFGTAPQM